MNRTSRAHQRGIAAALLSAVLLGTAPIFGKQAYVGGITPLGLAAWRTLIAATALWLVYLFIGRKYIYIYPVGLLGCFAVGATNGIGSLFYYFGLQRVDAGVGQMVYSLYPFFLVILLRLDGQRFSPLTLIRIIMAIIGVILLSQQGDGPVDLLGLFAMLIAGFGYALHLVIGQRVSYEMPAQTLTLYALSSMAFVVCLVYLVSGWAAIPVAAWQATSGLALITVGSRLGMFLGVKRLGSMQTALIGITEILVTLLLAMTLLNEALEARQWLGAIILMGSLLMIGRERFLGTVARTQPGEATTTPSSPVTSSSK
jgi:drug/metabolite transporter (DMT)-like permease